MLGTYASALLLLGAASLVGQAIVTACGRRRPSCLAPAVGLAALCALAWWTVRLPGEGASAAIACGVATALAGAYLAGRLEGLAPALRIAVPVALAALALASLPFIVEGRFGILGTGLNPDMSQHLFAADRLAQGASERLIAEGYPLGPHSLAVALTALGPTAVQAFAGLTLAIAAAACVAALAPLAGLGAWRRIAGALCIGFAYLVAAYLVQGSFKETMQALFLLAFALGLGELARGWPAGAAARPLRALPLAVLAIGSVYAYSFPGLLWLAGAAAAWAAWELVRAARRGGAAEARLLARLAAPAAVAALALVSVATAPELGRILDFASFETFDPAGAGLGNLFDRLSPLEALGIWPSGDFRVEPGGGAVPALFFYLGAAAGALALAVGLRWWLRRGDRAVPAALAAATLLWLYALVAGTPYQEAKALVMVAALVALVSVRALLTPLAATEHAGGRAIGAREGRSVWGTLAAVAFLLAAGVSSVVVLVNGPVGPSGYSPQLAELADRFGGDGVQFVVRAPDELLDDRHGRDYLAWELRGNRVCLDEVPGDGPAPAGTVDVTVGLDEDGAVVPLAAPGLGDEPGELTCPLIPDTARADPSAGG